MFELNEQELVQVVGGHGHYGSQASADGGAATLLGVASSSSYSSSKVTIFYSRSSAKNDSFAIGYGAVAASESQTSADTHH